MQEVDIATWEHQRRETLSGLLEALEIDESELGDDPLVLLPVLNRFVEYQDYDSMSEDDFFLLHAFLSAYVAEVLIRKYGATWRVRHDSRGPNYMLAMRGYDGEEHEVSPGDVVYFDFKKMPPDLTRMLATAELTAKIYRPIEETEETEEETGADGSAE
jgi:hypothetical protein